MGPRGETWIRPACGEDRDALARMRPALWPDSSPAEVDELLNSSNGSYLVLVATGPDGGLCGFAEVGIRNIAEGCNSSPVGYLEGIWVEPGMRRSGVGRALVDAGELWVAERGCREFASDCAVDNTTSNVFHTALGFIDVGRVVCFKRNCAEEKERK